MRCMAKKSSRVKAWLLIRAIEDTLDVDIFDAPRQDWLNKTDSYLRT